MRRRKFYGSGFERNFGFESELDALSEILKPAQHKGEYLDYKQSKDIVINNQPAGWKPEDPPIKPTSFPSDLHYFVREELENRFQKQSHQDFKLEFFTAVGSTLDKLHGVDAFFNLTLPSGKIVTVTIDITQNPDKATRGHKADAIILLPPNFLDTDQETATAKQAAQREREDKEQKWAKEIVNIIEEKLSLAA